MIGQGSSERPLSEAEVETIIGRLADQIQAGGRRVLVVIPDATRSAPMALLFAHFGRHLHPRAAGVDYLIALGTHRPMSAEAVAAMLGVPRAAAFAPAPGVRVFNHSWREPGDLAAIGQIGTAEARVLTGGLLERPVTVRINRLATEYDRILLCGPVFPHEVAGFSGGAKYLFPGIAGPEIIDFTHWLGALHTSLRTIGVRDTPVRRVIERAAEFLGDRVFGLSMAMRGHDLHGLWAGGHREAFLAAAELSAALNIEYLEQPVESVLSAPSTRYEDLWTAAKAMYKTEPVVADGGEVVIFAPHLREVSHTHGPAIRAVGYHVRDYFVKQWNRFGEVPGTILAHSTHVKGSGTYGAGGEQPRIRVTLATGIPEAVCAAINLGYRDPQTVDPDEWSGAGRLVVREAGERLYRLAAPDPRQAPGDERLGES